MYNKSPKHIKVADSKHVAHYLHTNRLAKPLPYNYVMAQRLVVAWSLLYVNTIRTGKNEGIKKPKSIEVELRQRGDYRAYIMHVKGHSYPSILMLGIL